MYGHLVGDAMGVPYEGMGPEAIGEIEVRGGGRHGQQPGTWSDDGALMLALADSLASVGFHPRDQGERALAWVDKRAYTPGREGAFDIGGATSRAIVRLRDGIDAIQAGGAEERDCGNGSLMRILPVALWEEDADGATLIERAHLASRVTHGHPRCQVTCALYVLIARALLSGQTNAATALDASVERLQADTYHGRPEMERALTELVTHRSDPGVRYGRAYVLDAFWSAWDAFALGGSYAETIERAIGYGHDTDTTAAIAGGLAGIRYGMEGIPLEWLHALRGREIVEEIAARL
jgi:ADP-ribosyl-[dinitrogen reductase] hydrolase